MGVRRIIEFNIALLGRWCWRMVTDRVSYGLECWPLGMVIEGSSLREGGRNGSVWWQQMARIREGVGVQVDGWFEEKLSRRWGMERILTFGQTGGWGEMCLVFGSDVCLSCLLTNGRWCRTWLG